MSFRPLALLSLVLAIITLSASACRSSESELPEPIDLESIRETVLRLEEAANLEVDSLNCDAGVARFGSEQPIFVSNGNVVRTSAELGEVCESMIAPRTGAEFSIEHRTANVLSNEVAYVVREGDYAIHFRDGSSDTIYLVMTTVWHHGVDGWKIAHLHESVRVQP